MSNTNVYKGLVSDVQSFLNGQGIGDSSIQFPNEKPVDQNESMWARVNYLSNPLIPVSTGLGGLDRLTGVLIVNLYAVMGSSMSAYNTIENAAMSRYWNGKTLTFGGTTIYIQNVGFEDGGAEDNTYVKSLSLSFKSDIQRSTS